MSNALPAPTDEIPTRYPALERAADIARRCANAFDPHAYGSGYISHYRYWREMESIACDCIKNPFLLESFEIRYRSAFGDRSFDAAMADRNRAWGAR